MDSSTQQYSIEDLAKFMQSYKEDGKPCVFVTGAGCSITAGIPSANQMVKEMNEQFSSGLAFLSAEDRKDYGKCMENVEVSKRRTYLKNYIEKAKVNWAHIALACLIKEGYINRVLTFNFDNLLARSCGLLGLYPATYDFTTANLNLYSLMDDPAIVHLHGQGHGFVQLNSQSETIKHAPRLKEFVRHNLNESPTIFIGYSGKNDAFLPQIEEQFSGQHRLFWIGMEKQAPEHLQHSILTSSLAHYMSCENGSDQFLIHLAQQLGCFPPTIFADPYQHLLDELDEIANYPMPQEEPLEDKKKREVAHISDSTQDILLETKTKLREVQQRERDGNTNFLQEYLQGNYKTIIQVLEGKPSLNNEQQLWLARSYFSLAVEQSDVLEEIVFYNKIIQKFSNSDEFILQDIIAKTLFNKSIRLGELNKPEDKIAVFDVIIERFGSNNELYSQEQVAQALMGKAITLGALQQSKNAIDVYNEIDVRFGDSEELIIQEQLAKALFNKAVAFGNLGQSKNTIKIYDELITRFGESCELVLQDQVAKAFINKAITLEELEQLEDAISVFDELIKKIGSSGELILQEYVIKALSNKAMVLSKLGKHEAARLVYDKIIECFGNSNEPTLQRYIPFALNGQGIEYMQDTKN